MERKFTDDEIVKALECFAIDKDFDERQCVGCAFETKGLCCENCSEGIAKASLDLINRQKAEIERLNSCVKTEEEVRTIAESVINSQIAFIKSKAIKEFAERLKKSCFGNPYLDDDVLNELTDSLVNEMTGEDNGN